MYEALNFAIKNKNIITLREMLNKWPYHYAMMDMLDMVLAKTDQRIIKFYEESLGDHKLKITGAKLRKQLSSLINLNRKIIPNYILEQRKEYRDSIRKRNTYAEVLNILQADIMKKLYKKKLNNKDKKLLTDAILITILAHWHGIAAAMKKCRLKRYVSKSFKIVFKFNNETFGKFNIFFSLIFLSSFQIKKSLFTSFINY